MGDSIFGGEWRSLRAAHSFKVLDVTGGSTSVGTRLEQWTQLANHPNQQFTFEPLDDGYYRIVARHSGKVLDIEQASMDDGAPLIQYDWKGGDNQRFSVDDVGDGNFVITAKHSGKVLDVAGASQSDGAAVTQWGRHGRARTSSGPRWETRCATTTTRWSEQLAATESDGSASSPN